MIWHITQKELHQNLITSRFIVGAALTILLSGIVTWVMIAQYSLKTSAYNSSVQENEEHLKNLYVYSEMHSVAVKPPEILSVYCGGVADKMGGLVEISRQDVPYQASPYVMDNPLLKVFQSIDLALVFKLIMSLMALLFSFDLFCGEKENGTLRLILTGRVSRAGLYAGKFFGGLLTLGVILFLALLSSLLVLFLRPEVNLTVETVLRVMLIFLVTLVYVSTFFSIGALVSALTHNSATSLTMSLFIWATLAVGLPNLANYTAERLKPIESSEIITKEEVALGRELMDKIFDYPKTHPLPPWAGAISGSTDEWSGIYKFNCGHLNTFKYFKHFIPFSEELRLEYAEKIFQSRQSYILSLKKQADFMDRSSLFSPVRLYENLSSILSRTDLETQTDFLDQARMYRNQMIDYFRVRNAFHDTRFYSIMTEEEAPDVDMAKVFQDGSAERKIWMKSMIEYKDRPYLALQDFPRFNYSSESLSRGLQRALPEFSLLVLLNLAFIALGYFRFAGYDVR